MSDKITNINHNFTFNNCKIYYELVEKMLLINNLHDYLLAFVDFVLNGIQFTESSIYLYKNNDILTDIIENNQSNEITNNIEQLEEGGIFDFVKNTHNISLIPNLNNISNFDSKYNFLIVPLEYNLKIIGFSISITNATQDDLLAKNEEMKVLSRIFTFFLFHFINSINVKIINQDNSNDILHLIVNNIFNSNQIILANNNLIKNKIGDSNSREDLNNFHINNIKTLNSLYNKYQNNFSNKFKINEILNDILIINNHFLSDNNLNLTINFLNEDIEIKGNFCTFASIILKIINLDKNKEVNNSLINIKINHNKFIQEIAIFIDVNCIYFENLDNIKNSFSDISVEIVKIISLINEFDAQIDIESNFNNGTTFKLIFNQ